MVLKSVPSLPLILQGRFLLLYFMKILKLNSPNFDKRPDNSSIDTLIIHHTNMQDADSALKRLCSPEYTVSSHYLIDKHGVIYQLVPDHLRAWHAGISSWRGRESVNNFSIGIELDNQGAEPFPLQQIDSLIALSKELITKHPIEARNVIAHYDIAPHRKDDPNHFFKWELLASEGIGIFPNINYTAKQKVLSNLSYEDIIKIQHKLKIFGYSINPTGEFDFQTARVIIAFKRHFCSSSFLNNNQELWTLEAEKKLNHLMSIINEES